MRKRYFNTILSLVMCCVLLFSSVLSVAAIDDTYDIEEIGVTIKIPKEFTVITRTTERGDEAFATLDLDYDDTMTAFSAADIYLQAFSEGEVLKIELTQSSDENSQAVYDYNELSSAQRSVYLDVFLDDPNYTSGVEVKHNDSIYFDMNLKKKTNNGYIYAYQCHTVVNGMKIILSLEKSKEELTADEIKIITNIANNMSFDDVSGSGLSFDWWRFLLWIVILVAIALIANYLFRQYNAKKRSKMDKRRERVRSKNRELMSEEDKLINGENDNKTSERTRKLLSELGIDDLDDEYESFDQMLGYDSDDFFKRANTELDTFDIDVKGKDESSGMSYFEDEGQNIDDKADYFEDYFEEETDRRPAPKRAASSVALNAKVIARRCGYFKKNLSNKIKKKDKSKRKY